MTPVTGSWGTGRLFTSKLVSALFVDSCSAPPSGATSMNTNDGMSIEMPRRWYFDSLA